MGILLGVHEAHRQPHVKTHLHMNKDASLSRVKADTQAQHGVWLTDLPRYSIVSTQINLLYDFKKQQNPACLFNNAVRFVYQEKDDNRTVTPS